MELLIKIGTFGIALYTKLEMNEILIIIILFIICIYIGYLISNKLKPVINTDFKIQCPKYSELQSGINAWAVERWLTATTKNGKIVTIGCPFYTKNGKCNNEKKCNKV
jgi:hypothetical protein